MTAKHPMTRAGFGQLKKELERLTQVERQKNIKEIAEARSHGDLSENAEYHAAKERQAYLEAKIREIGAKLAHAQVIDTEGMSSDKVVFGATVLLSETETGEERRYRLVGADESDPGNGWISVQSPVGRALIGKQVGDLVTVRAPARTIEYEVLEITFE